jgi:hypothetical protein
MDGKTCTPTKNNCQSTCCRSWEQYLKAELSKFGKFAKPVIDYLEDNCPKLKKLKNDPTIVSTILQAVKKYYKNNNGVKLFENINTLYNSIEKICNTNPTPAADISQGGMLGGIVRDSSCASGYAVSGTHNPNTGRPYCTQ